MGNLRPPPARGLARRGGRRARLRAAPFGVVLAFAALAPGRAAAQGAELTTLQGVVYDTLSDRPLHAAVVRVADTSISTITDEAGRFQLTLPAGTVRLEVRRIGYQPSTVTVPLHGAWVERTFYLKPIPITLSPIVVAARDDFALRVIVRAIAHKHQLLSHIHDYRYNAFVKFVVRDLDQHPDSASSVLLITETRTTAYWEQPDRYQETILARRQSRNLNARDNLISVGDIPNFMRDRIDLQKYSFVSPIADDALAHYDYRVLDTLEQGGHRVFRLAIEPRSASTPLFVGMIDIADSTYDVYGIDVGVNAAVRLNIFKNLRYRQWLRDVGGGRWMPYEIRFTGEITLGVPLPGFPEHMGFEHVADLDSFRFDEGHPPSDLGEFRMVVRDRVDKVDSTTWQGAGAIPLTAGERAAWARIDSLRNIPPPLADRMLQGAAFGVKAIGDPGYFHFDRVEGPYVGFDRSWYDVPGAAFRTKLGYATGADEWEYRFGALARVWEEQRVWVGASYHDEVENRRTLASQDFNPTYGALFWRVDPLDYYRDQGLVLTLTTKVLDFTDLEFHYNDLRQSSLGVVTGYSVFTPSDTERANPPMEPGHLRTLTGTLAYDSRPMLRAAGQDYYFQMLTRTRASVTVEVSRPSLIPSDFDFTRYSFHFERRQRLFNLGLTTIMASGGYSTGVLPPQRDFVVDFGMQAPLGVDLGLMPPSFAGGGVNTLYHTNFGGSEAALLTVRHDFDRLLFAKSGLPLIRSLPFTLNVHGGIFWTEFREPPAASDLLVEARTPYEELGFGLGNLTPFLSPFNCVMRFTWQLSHYPTRGFEFLFTLTSL